MTATEDDVVEAQTVHVPDIIDKSRVSAFQYLIVLLCSLVLFIDGFDTQAISYMAPFIAKEWGLSRQLLGPIFSSALVGLMTGYLAFSPLSDRFGHRRVLITSTIVFGLFTGMTVIVANLTELITLRFLTGVGLGAAIPSAVALTSEYTPKRRRASFVSIIYCGLSLGFVADGIAAAWLLPAFGWRSLLWVGAAVPLVVSVLLLLLLPESLNHLVRTGANIRQVWSILCRIDARLAGTPAPSGFTADREEEFSTIGSVFQAGRAAGTILLWFVFILNLGESYGLASWIPTILTNQHYALSTIATTTSLTNAGGIIAAFVVGPAMDRIGAYRSLVCLYLAGVVFVALTGFAINQPLLMLLTSAFFAGFCVSGGDKSAIALAALFYPAALRSTGVGWALGVGRIGGIAGPILIGLLLDQDFAPRSIFFAAAIALLPAAAAVAMMGRLYGQANAETATRCVVK